MHEYKLLSTTPETQFETKLSVGDERGSISTSAGSLLNSVKIRLQLGSLGLSQGMALKLRNRGFELKNKTVGLMGYGNTGKSFAKKLTGLNVNIIFYDIKIVPKNFVI